MALRSILLIPSRWMVGGLAPSRLLGGGTGTGKEGVCSRWAGAFAEQADSTCPPGATGKSTPMLWASWPRGQSPDGQALASLREPCGASGAAGTCLGQVRLPEPQFSHLSSGESDSCSPVSAKCSLAAEERVQERPLGEEFCVRALSPPVCPHLGWRAGELGDRNLAATWAGGCLWRGSGTCHSSSSRSSWHRLRMTPPLGRLYGLTRGVALQHPPLPWPQGAHRTSTPERQGGACCPHAPGPHQQLRIC